MKRKIVLVFLVFISFIMQSTLFQAFARGSVVPNVLILVTSCFGFMRGKREGMFVGFLCGILSDIFFGGGVLGVYALVYLFIGYMNGFFHRVFYPEDIKLPILFVFISDLSYGLISYILLFLFRARFNFPVYMKSIILPEMVYTILVTLVLYRIILGINNLLEKDEKKKEAKFA